jgi:hypothetical protein
MKRNIARVVSFGAIWIAVTALRSDLRAQEDGMGGQKKANAVIDVGPPPPTLAEMVSVSDLVVFARVVGIGDPEIQGAGRFQRVRRMQQIEVIEALKGPSSIRPGTPLTIRQFGGTAFSKDDWEVVSDYPMRLFERGDQILLFLNHTPGIPGAYDIAYERNGATWRNSDGSTDLPDGLQRMPEIGNRRHLPLAEVFDLVRRGAPGT